MDSAIKEAMKMLNDYKYKPSAVWLNIDGKTVYITTDNIDRAEYAKLLKKFKNDKEP